jgi:two-component system response regulator
VNPVERIVLLVEDDPGDVELIRRVFEASSILNRVEVARDGHAALERLAEHGAHDIALVLLDLKLPKVHGLEVLRRIRADPATHALRVVVLTSSFDDEERLAAFSSGANSFVRKPIDFESFVQAIREIGLYWLIVDQGPPR